MFKSTKYTNDLFRSLSFQIYIFFLIVGTNLISYMNGTLENWGGLIWLFIGAGVGVMFWNLIPKYIDFEMLNLKVKIKEYQSLETRIKHLQDVIKKLKEDEKAR